MSLPEVVNQLELKVSKSGKNVLNECCEEIQRKCHL